MKNVLFLIPTLMHGGAEKVLVNLVNNLDKTKYDVTLFSLFDVGVNKQFLDESVKYRFKFKKIFRGNSQFLKFFSPKFLYKWIINDDYDIVVSFLEGPAARIISGSTNPETKKIAWIHTEQRDEKLVSVGFRNVREAKILYNKFDIIVGVSQDIVDSVQKNISNNVRSVVLYNVNETDDIVHKSNFELSKNLFLDTQMKKVCSVGKVSEVKGYNRLLEVHKRLIDEQIQHFVTIVGIGEERSRLEKKAMELGVSNTFKFLGFFENPYPIIKKSDLFVCSSYREGFSTAVTESLILGTPVLSTKVSGAKELLGENDEFGIVTENSTEGIYKGLKEILTNPETYNHYKKQAEIRGSFFSKERTIKAMEDLFDSLLS